MKIYTIFKQTENWFSTITKLKVVVTPYSYTKWLSLSKKIILQIESFKGGQVQYIFTI